MVLVKGNGIIKDFYICDHPVTQREYQDIMCVNPSLNQNNALDNPVECVSYYHAIAFCNKKSIMNNKALCYDVKGVTNWASLPYDDIPIENDDNWNDAKLNKDADGYRLPTKEEWIYAAKGGIHSQGYLYSGSNIINDVAWYDGNSDSKTHCVKKKQDNELQLYDMSGNICEWIEHIWYLGSECPSNKYTFICGGNFYYPKVKCTVLSNDILCKNLFHPGVGFRIAKNTENTDKNDTK